MKKQNLRSFTGTLLTGICLFASTSVFAASVTLTGPTGTSSSVIVIPPEYEGLEGNIVVTASSTNQNSVSYGQPYISGEFVYVEKYITTYSGVAKNISMPYHDNGTQGSTSNLASGSCTISCSQTKTVQTQAYSLYKNYWADTEAQTFQEMLYYAEHGTFPASSGISSHPSRADRGTTRTTVTSGVVINSAYLVVFGVDDGSGNETPTPPPATGDTSDGGGDTNVNVNVTSPGTDDGVYTLISSLFDYIAEMQNVLSASDEAIRSELLAYITELQSAYQMADSQLAATIQNQINALNSALSNDIASLRSSLEGQIATLRNQISGLQTQQNALLSEFYSLKADLLTAIQNNSADIGKLSEELKEKYDALVSANTTLRADLQKEMADLADAYKEADAALIADYSSKLSALQTLMQQADSSLADNIRNLQSAYQTADLQLKENLELQLANLRNQMNDADKQIMQEIAVLETAMNNADDTLKADYTNKIAALEQRLSTEAAALRTEMSNLQKSYQTEIAYLKENLELQIKSLKDQTQNVTNDLQKQIDALNKDFSKQIADLNARHDAELAALAAKSEKTDAELKAAMEAYVIALQQQMKNADDQLKADLQGQLDNLSGAFNERLKVVISEYEQRINAVKKNINDLESDTKTKLITQKALLEQECANKISALQKEYAELIAKSDNPETLEAELASKISETNLNYRKQILEIEKSLAGLSEKTAAELLAELAELQSKKEMAEAALKSTDYNEKLSLIVLGNKDNADEAHAELEAKLAKLERELAALKELGDLSIEDVIAKIKAGDAANAAELENLKIALKLYCDRVKDALNARISTLENTISALQNALQQRMQTLENRLTYSLMTDEELENLEKSKQELVNSLANQIAGLELAIKNAKAEGQDTSALESKLASLTLEYANAQSDLENVKYVRELRSNSELALHRKWIKELQELTVSLQITVKQQGDTIKEQKGEIEGLKTIIANLEKALQTEIKNLEETLKKYVDDNVTDLNAAAEDMKAQLETLRDNIVTLATSAYSGYSSSSTGNNNNYNYSGTNKETLVDDRDLRTSKDTALDF